METIKIKTSQNIEIDYEVAGLGERIVGYIIDMAIFIAVYFLIIFSGFATMMSGGTWGRTFITFIVIWLASLALYDLVCEIFFNGQSIGKRVMKVRVISIDGGRPRVGQYILRWLFRIVDFTLSMGLAGLLGIAFSTKKQRIGDMVAGTTLIKVNPKTSMDHIAFIQRDETYKAVFPEASELKEKDIVLIHEVLKNFEKSENYSLLHSTASRVKEHLRVNSSTLDDEQFLKTIIKDYNYFQSQPDLV